jgi:hypothetical protein
MFQEKFMNFPEWDESESDKELIEEFYVQLPVLYPELKEDVEYNEGLLHVDMGDLQRLAERLCKDKKLEEAASCFTWVNSFFCRSKNELLNAINVSFLEYFEYCHGLSDEEFERIMPVELFRGYKEMMAYMEKMAKASNEDSKKIMKQKGPPYQIEFGNEGQLPPSYVRIIGEDRIILSGALDQMGLDNEILFAESGELEGNSELTELMLKLNEIGVVFSYDPKSMVSPSCFMGNLQAKGLLQKSYKEISWQSQKSWLLTTYELA